MEAVQRNILIALKVWKLHITVKNSTPYTNGSVKVVLDTSKLHIEYRLANGVPYILRA